MLLGLKLNGFFSLFFFQNVLNLSEQCLEEELLEKVDAKVFLLCLIYVKVLPLSIRCLIVINAPSSAILRIMSQVFLMEVLEFILETYNFQEFLLLSFMMWRVFARLILYLHTFSRVG